MNDGKQDLGQEPKDSAGGVEIRAGEQLYIPPGGLRLWANSNETIGGNVSIAVDPWLPDLSASSGTPTDVIKGIIKRGFPISSIGTKTTVNACQKSHQVQTLLATTETIRIKHIAVIDGSQACGVLDLDKARGQTRSDGRLLVADIYEPLNEQNCLHGDSPLIDYILTCDKHPFRLIQLANNELGTVDVEDLQKVPVRVLIFMKLTQLETLLARQLCAQDPTYREVVRIVEGQTSELLGNSGAGPERRIERLYFKNLLQKAKDHSLIDVTSDEIAFLNRYRNNIAHGPRWYITRRAEVGAFVNCVKRISGLVEELDAGSR